MFKYYRSFSAPVVLYLYGIPPGDGSSGAYVALGIFLQSLILAALKEGLANCPQQTLAEYPKPSSEGSALYQE
ncbi:hypothetical protein [Candidatus Thiosymbion oneisti]|uniref:hypothetical protein n=1 Tax=Candidatus Thiosymbion oneisti TaxID=589554 RepID=UPI000B7E74A8|nr:hypothetical protein [Candidatus Thiosymbion oneisti]